MLLAHRFTLEIDDFGVVQQSVEDEVSQGGIVELAVSELDRQLTGEQDAAALMAIFQQFQ